MNLPPRLASLLRGKPSDTLEQRNARNLIWSGAWLGFIDGGILTYLSVWLARMGGTPGVLSILSSGPQLVNMIAMMPASAFVERKTDLVRLANRAAIITRCGYLIIAVLPFFLPWAAIPVAVIIVWSLFAIPGAVHMPTLMSVIQKAVPPQMRAQVNANRWALYSVVGALAIPTIGIMIDRVGFPTGYQLAFVISFVGSIPNLYFFSKIRITPFKAKRENTGENQPVSARLRQFFGPFFESKRFVRFNVSTAIFRICLSLPMGLYSIYWVDNLHASDTLIGLRGSLAYITLVFAYSFWGRMVNRIGHRNLLFFAAFIGLYPIMTGLATSAVWLLPAAVAWGLFVAAIDIGLVDMLLLACPEGRQPSFIGLANVLASAELMVGPLIGAALAHVIGVQAALIVSGFCVIASGAFFILLPSREEERREHTSAPVVETTA